MTIAGTRAARGEPAPSAGRLWFGVAGAPLAWAAVEAFGWWLGAYACGGPEPRLGPLGATGVAWLWGAVALAGLVVAAAAVALAWRSWLETNHEGVLSIEGASRPGFMAASGVISGAIFVVAIVWTGIPMALTDACGQGR